jgi:4-amino-4-deoxy-L-arabinose transferase-like glycosyltransferase
MNLSTRRAAAMLVAAVALLYLFARLATLWRYPAYYDESFYALTAYRAHLLPALRFDPLLDSKGPLLTWISLIPLAADEGHPLQWVRTIAAIAGAITIVFAAWVAARLFDRAVAVAAALVLVVLPLALVQGAMGIHEPLVAAAAMVALYLQIRLAQDPRLDLSLLLGLALGAGLLTKDSGVFAVLLLPLSLLVVDWNGVDRTRHVCRWLLYALVAVGIGYLAHSLMRLSPQYYEGLRRREALDQYNTIGSVLENLGPILQLNWPGYRVALIGYITAPLLLVAGAAAGLLLATRLRVALLLLAWILLPIAVAVLVANKPLGRYLLPAAAPLAILIAAGLVAAVRWALAWLPDRPWRTWVVAGALLALALPALVFDARVLADPARAELPGFDDREIIAGIPSGNAWPDVAAAIRHERPEGGIVALTEMLADGLPLALDDPATERYPMLWVSDPNAVHASFVVENGSRTPPLCGDEAPITPEPPDVNAQCSYIDPALFRLVLEYDRPRGGKTVRLYVRR